MPQTTTLVTKGLYTYPDLLAEVPPGSLTVASNTVIDRDGVIAPRRGFAIYGNDFGSQDDIAKQVLYYKARLLRHWATSLDFDSDGEGTFINMANNITEQKPNLRIKSQEMNGNLYFTTDKGVQKISATVAANVSPLILTGNTYTNFLVDGLSSTANLVVGLAVSDTVNVTVTGNTHSNNVIDGLNSTSALIPGTAVSDFYSVQLQGNTHSNLILDGLSSTSNLVTGMLVTGPGIQPETTITAISSGTAIMISLNASTVSLGQFTFSYSSIPASTTILAITGPNSITITHNATESFMSANITFTSLGVIPSGTLIQTIVGPNSITLSQPTTGNVVGETITFGIQAPVTTAGGVEALDGFAYINPIQGWFLQNSEVAYRIVWGINDVNQNLILGTPSQRIILDNPQLALSIADFNKLLLALDIAASTPPTILTGSIGAGPATLITVTSTAALSIGMLVADTGGYIQAGTTILDIDSPTTLTLSLPTTNVAAVPSDTFTFSQTLTNTTFNTLELPANASSLELYNALQSLSEMLDASLNETIYNGLSGSITAITPSASITGTGNPNNTNVISGISSVEGVFDGMYLSGPGVAPNTTVTSFSSPSPILLSGTLNSGTIISALTSTASLSIGMLVTGSGITAGTTIQNVPVPLTGNGTGTTTITGLSSVANLYVGMAVYDDTTPSNITAGTTIVSIGVGSVVVSANTGTFTGDSLSFGADEGTIVITESAANSNVGVNLTFTNNTITFNNVIASSAAGSTFTLSYPTVVTSPDLPLIVGNQYEITITGSNSSPSIDSTTPIVATVINANQFTIPTVVTAAGNSGTWYQYPLAVSQNYLTPPENPATTAELVLLENFYDALVNQLNLDENISDAAREAIGGEFLNSTQTATANIIFTVPSLITTSYFYQVYRGDMSTAIGPALFSDVAADDELKLIVQQNITQAQIDSGYVNFYDNVPESYRVSGANLYTNAISGSGILQENTPPPYCQDMTLWLNFMFYANTSEKHQLTVDLLTGDLVGGTFTIQWNGIFTTFTFVGEAAQITSVTTPAGSTFATTGVADNFELYNAQNYTTYEFWFDVAGGTMVPPVIPGAVVIPIYILPTDSAASVAAKVQLAMTAADNDFTTDIFTPVTLTGNTHSNMIIDNLSSTADLVVGMTVTDTGGAIPATTFITAITSATAITISNNATLTITGDTLTFGDSSTITLINTNPGFTNSPINSVTAPGFSIAVALSGSGEQASTQLVGVPASATPAQQIDAVARSLIRIVNHNPQCGVDAQYLSSNTSLPGQISFEAIETSLIPFYLTASANIGADFSPALPVSGETVASTNQASPNRLYFSKIQEPDAVPQVNYQNVGQEDYPILRLMPLRDSLFILKTDGVFRLYGTDPTNFTVYLFDSSSKLIASDTAAVLNNQVYMFSNQGVISVSDTGVSVVSRPIEGELLPINLFPNFATISFGVSYESDRAYHLWVQDVSTDTKATICYRFNVFTNTWVDWPISKACGVVIPDTNVMYLGPTDTNFIEQERKSFTRFDQADRDYLQVVPVGGVNGPVLSLGSVFEAEPGDAMVQIQYLTIGDFNRLINKLDIDPGTSISYLPYLASPGYDLGSQIILLAAALDSDPNLQSGGAFSAAVLPYADGDFASNQLAFNAIITLITDNLYIRLHSYTPSTNTTGWEVLVTAINTVQNSITTAYALPFIAGPIYIYKAIDSITQWAPQTMGDPSMLKKVYEGTIMFQNMAFDNGILSYSSDLYTAPQPIAFPGEGGDAWGGSYWGNTTWGGDGSFRPVRTLIPVPVQRCRFIQPQFEHDNALRTYAIFGVSYTWEGISSRAYR